MLPDGLKDARRILAVRLDNIGDVIMLSPALRELKRALPAAEITLLASPGGAQAAPMLPWVDQVIPWRASWQEIAGRDTGGAQKEQELVETLKEQAFDAAFLFTSFNQSPHPPGYVCYLAGIPHRFGQSKEFGGLTLSQWVRPLEDSAYQVDRNLHLLREAGVPIHDDHMELRLPNGASLKAGRILAANGLAKNQPFILLAPGASAQARRYPLSRFIQAAEMLANQTGMKVVITGSQREEKLLSGFQRAARRNPGLIWLVGQTTLMETAALVKRAALVVANNSASLHLAEAFQRPMVILYSGTETLTQWSPRYAPALILNRPVDCSPCYAFQCPYQQECLDIPAKQVVSEAIQFFDSLTRKGRVFLPQEEFSYSRINS